MKVAGARHTSFGIESRVTVDENMFNSRQQRKKKKKKKKRNPEEIDSENTRYKLAKQASVEVAAI